MKTRLIWKECDLFEKRDAFWVECSQKDFDKQVEPFIRYSGLDPNCAFDPEVVLKEAENNKEKCLINEVRKDAKLIYFFMISKDLSCIRSYRWVMPYSGQWNAWWPFTEFEPIEFSSLDELGQLLESSNSVKTEKVFEIGGEGGGISISRQKSEAGVTFIYHHSEFDPTGEGLSVKKLDEYATFEEPFQRINNSYPWYSLYIMTIHEDYKAYIIENLMEKLNEKAVSPEYFDSSKNQLEHMLGIEIKCNLENENGPRWTCVNN